jgi:hypothetical protein
VVVGVVAFVYGLVTKDWAFALKPVSGCVVGTVIVAAAEAAIGRRSAVKKRRNASSEEAPGTDTRDTP